MQKSSKIKASVIGASGYSGVELVRLLSRHPYAEIGALIANSSAGKSLDEITLQQLPGSYATLETYSAEALNNSDVVFIALPSGEAATMITELVSNGKKVIDLGGDLRLHSEDEHAKFYGKQRPSAEIRDRAVYGLTEFNRHAIANATVVSNPGCFATSAIIPLVPMIEFGIVDPKGISINALSGVSGAGKKATLDYSFTELNDNVKAYRTGGTHQHIPEIRQAVCDFSGKKSISFAFTPHLLPVTRGIYTTITAPLSAGVGAESVRSAFESKYANEAFVSLTNETVPTLSRVTHTNMIEIGWAIDREANMLVVFSAIDNLLKGAAGQAVQNMNVMFGFEERVGL